MKKEIIEMTRLFLFFDKKKRHTFQIERIRITKQVMKMTIYIDIVIAENLMMNSIILYATSMIAKIKPNFIRILIGSLIGAIYSVFSYVSTWTVYSNMLLKLILSIIIVYIAFNPQNIKIMGKDLLLFYLTSFVFGGVAFALIYVIKPQEILMRNGLFLGTYPLKTVFLGAIIAFAVIWATFKIVKTKISKKDMYCDAKIKFKGKEILVKTMIDTGNMLKEPISGNPVIIVEHTVLYDIIPKEILNHLEDILGGDFNQIEEKIRNEYSSKLKLIPFSSLGKQNGMLLGIKAEKVLIEKEGEKTVEKNNVIIGIYNKSLTKRGEYRALIGIDLI